MKRRSFLKHSASVAATPIFLNGMPLHVLQSSSVVDCEAVQDRVLVIIQLFGGNDGINTTIPLDQYGTYSDLRPDIKIPDSGAGAYLTLDANLPDSQQVGLHPSAAALKALYDNDKLAFIQGVSYNAPNRSHFKSEDLWLSGGDGTQGNASFNTGWMGRYLAYTYPGMAGNPTPDFQDPLGIQLGQSRPSLGFTSPEPIDSAVNLSGQNPEGYYTLVNEIGGLPIDMTPDNVYGRELDHIMSIEDTVRVYAERITSVFNAGSNSDTEYPSSSLGNQLRTIARLIKGGSKTKIYLAYKSGFDNHTDQVDSDNATTGRHANLLADVANSMAAFQEDLQNLDIADKVMTVTWSEFGRTADQNANYGTDHGTLAPMFVMGESTNTGVYGNNINLGELDNRAPTGQQFDYRQIFSGLIQDWLGASNSAVSAAYMEAFLQEKVPVIHPELVADPSCYFPIDPLDPQQMDVVAVDRSVEVHAWIPETNDDSHTLELQRARPGRPFRTIQVFQQADLDAGQLFYVDDDPLPGASQYRLQQKNFWGRVNGVSIASVYVRPGSIEDVRLFPNPINRHFTVALESKTSFVGTFEVFDTQGHRLMAESVEVVPGDNRFLFSTDFLPQGQLLGILSDPAQGIRESLKMVVVKR